MQQGGGCSSLKIDDYLKSNRIDADTCKIRDICPLKGFCGKPMSAHGGAVLTPSIIKVEKNGILWTDLHFDPKVLIVRKGVFACIIHAEREREEVPLGLYGAGIALGMGELFVPEPIPTFDTSSRDIIPMSSMYYMKSLFEGEICSLPANIVSQLLEEKPPVVANQIMSCVLTNQFCSVSTMMKVVSHQSLQDRIISLLLFFREMASRNEPDIKTFHITHSELSMLVASDRVSTTRALHKIRNEGYIDLGYKSITLLPSILDRVDLLTDARTEFYIPDDFE